MTRRIPLVQPLGGCCLVLLASAAVTLAASPALNTILPRGVQRGGEHVLTFNGARLKDAREIFFYDAGFEVSKIEPDGENRLKVTVKVDPNCRLGEHVAQVRTASGISEYRTLYVGDLPAVTEKEPNNEAQSAQPLELNVTINGVIQSEDIDRFVVQAKQGQRLSVEVEGMRLGTAFLDPQIAILDPQGSELAAVDDTALLLQDSMLSIEIPEDGKYVVVVRDSSYGGNNGTYYRMHIGTFPRPAAVYPAGGKLGETTQVGFIGDGKGHFSQTIGLPSEADDEFGVFAEDEYGVSPSPNPFRLFEHGNAFEQEPNDAAKSATPAELPLAMNGIIEKPGDIDYFKFQAKEGLSYEVECYARRIRSPLDPVMYLYDASGKRLASNDDSRGPDSYFRFKVPADGEYLIRVNDHLTQGGPNYVYRIEFAPVRPQLSLGIPRVERYSQYRQTIFVPRGNRFATLISASRRDFSGDLVLDGSVLPEGVTMIAQPMPANLNTMPVVFEAAADAPIEGQLIELTAHHTDPEKNIRGRFQNRADYVRNRPGQTIYRWRDVTKLAVAVVDELPFQLEIVEPRVPIVQNGSMKLKIVAHRAEGFKAPITIEFPFRPPGVSAASRVTIPEGKTQVEYPLNASSNAQVKKWQVYAIGYANVNGNAWVASQLADLEVAQQPVTFTMQRVSCDQGQLAQVLCKLNHSTPFDGQAKAQLLGLPSKVSTSEVAFDHQTQDLVFDVRTDPKSPAGRHKNVFCQVTIIQHGEPIVSRVGTVEIQINKPLPADQASAAVAKASSQKPLSRLEKLRMAAKQREQSRGQSTEVAAGGGGGQ